MYRIRYIRRVFDRCKLEECRGQQPVPSRGRVPGRPSGTSGPMLSEHCNMDANPRAGADPDPCLRLKPKNESYEGLGTLVQICTRGGTTPGPPTNHNTQTRSRQTQADRRGGAGGRRENWKPTQHCQSPQSLPVSNIRVPGP
jgi:hypothetical protein